MQTGDKLNHYIVGEKIGAGGMGEVFRAKDTKLGRDVALKVLPPEFAADQDRLARFKREAKVLAQLHHPNIASIFGLEELPEAVFLVMELVEGEDLAEILRSGPLPVDDAIIVAKQVAEGLEEAHENGIVHRDLKPANVKRTPDGKVKILDFGLAMAMAGESTGEDESVTGMATMTAAMTQAGMVLGTAAYMSPEQARGHAVDRRTDIWAFGVILYEMLSGGRLFEGETITDTLASVLKSEPDWGRLPDGVPMQVDHVIRRCLLRDPRQRLRDIGEARVRLEDPHAESGMFSGPIRAVEEQTGRSSAGRFAPWVLVAACLAAIGWLWFEQPGESSGTVSHLAVPAPDEIEFHITGSFPGLPEISPSGRRVAFSGVSQPDNVVDLYVRDLDSEQAVLLGDTRDAQYPFWSPDSRWLAYYSRATGLLKVPVDGGPTQRIAEATNGKGGAWNQFGEILFTTDYNTSIFMVSEGGGEVRQITDLPADEGFNSHRHPQFMPDGRHFLYFARGNGRVESEIRFASLDGEPHKVVTRANLMGNYGSGYLVYVTNGDLVAQPMDPDTGELSGSPTPLVGDVMTVPGAAKGVFSVSTTGDLVYLKGEATEDASLSWRARTGQNLEQVGDLAPYDMVELSPDGRSAVTGVITRQAGTWDLWIMDLARNFKTRFTLDPADDADMVWSRDSRGIYFTSDRGDNPAIFYKEIGSPDAPRQVFDSGGAIRLWDVTDDGKTLLYSQVGKGAGWDLWTADFDGESEPRLLRGATDHDALAKLSPDEEWLTFASRESGQWQVYVAPWPAMAPLTQVSTTTGTWSRWVKDGSELIFLDAAGNLNAVSMTVEDGRMLIGPAEELFQVGPPVLEAIYWSVSEDGEKFLTVNTHTREAPAYCNLLLGWPELLAGR